jgi:hypothetical protein
MTVAARQHSEHIAEKGAIDERPPFTRASRMGVA